MEFILPVSNNIKGYIIITNPVGTFMYIYTPDKALEYEEAKGLINKINESAVDTVYECGSMQLLSTGFMEPWSTFSFDLGSLGNLSVKKDDKNNYYIVTNENMRVSCGAILNLKSTLGENIEIITKLFDKNNIKAYLDRSANKINNFKTYPYVAKNGQAGYKIHSDIKALYNGKEYILKEEDSIVSERYMENGTKITDIVLTNIKTKKEKIVNAFLFSKIYKRNSDNTFSEIKEVKELYKVNENIVVLDKEPMICLKDSYIAFDGENYKAIEKRICEEEFQIM